MQTWILSHLCVYMQTRLAWNDREGTDPDDAELASGTTEMYLLELIESGTLQGMRASQHNQDFKSLAMPYVMEHHD